MGSRIDWNGKGQGHDGDKTTTGAICQGNYQSFIEEGKMVLRVGDKTTACPTCKQIGVIDTGDESVILDGVPVAVDGSVVRCGCPYGTNRVIAPLVPGASIPHEKLGYHQEKTPIIKSISDNDDEMDKKWLKVPKGQLTFDAEGNDDERSHWFSRHIHWPGGVSGITIGRGYDLGQQHSPHIDLIKAGIKEPLRTWLSVDAKGFTSEAAESVFRRADSEIKDEEITRKQQYNLFMISYSRLENDVRRICEEQSTIEAYHPNINIAPEQAWENIPDKIKEILVDLRYRGDYTREIRSHIQRAAYTGDMVTFGSILKDKKYWPRVPQDRFQRRVDFYEK